MNYMQINIHTNDSSIRDMLVALLSDMGFEGFEEKDEQLLAFIPQVDFNESSLNQLLLQFSLPFSVDYIEKTNWNKEWEQNFNPVVVDDFCTIRADFHTVDLETVHEIVITPKMSFGTGHHATTQLMIRMMRKLDFRNKQVFDFGTGTGILAILAGKLGAEKVIALDNESWAYENAIENAKRNVVENTIDIILGSLENIKPDEFDIILANINRHILLQYMNELYHKVKYGGSVIMSGLLDTDSEIITSAARMTGFKIIEQMEESKWIALWFTK